MLELAVVHRMKCKAAYFLNVLGGSRNSPNIATGRICDILTYCLNVVPARHCNMLVQFRLREQELRA